MRQVQRFFLLLIVMSALLRHSPVGRAQVTVQPPPVRLTAEIVNQQSCAINKLEILQIKLRLRYTNVGQQKLLLYAGKNFFYQTKMRSLPGAASVRPYEALVINSRYDDAMAEAVDRKSPGKAFVALAPGEAHEREITVGTGVVGSAAERDANTLAGGEHSLVIIASTWYESRKLAEELRQRWQRKGWLLIDPVVSEPLRFTVAAPHAKVQCQ